MKVKLLHTIILIFLIGYNCSAQHSLNKLPYPINTDTFDEICPVLNYHENLLFFTRVGSPDYNRTLIENGENLHASLDSEEYRKKLSGIFTQISGSYTPLPSQSTFNQDIWYADLMNNLSVSHPGQPINNALPNSICSNYTKNNEFVLINEFPVDGGLNAGFSITKLMDDGTFTIPIAIIIKNFQESGANVNLTMSNDRQYLFLAMENESSYGDQDIYLSRNAYNMVYGAASNIGRTINTEYREATPFISQDRRRLYFASNRPGGYGGMDIYYCERLDYTYRNWSEPKLLGPPINSPYDDSHPYVSLDENTIFFTSNREGTSDIYSAKMYRDDLLDKPVAVNINVYNEDSILLSGGEIFWHEAYTNKNQGFFRTNTGQYRYIIEDNIPMVFKAQRRSLKASTIMVDPQELKDQMIHEVTLNFVLKDGKTPELMGASYITKDEADPLDKEIIPGLESNKTIILNNIYFAQSKPEVLEESYPALEKLANVLKTRPHVAIKIEGHTDNVGEKKDLMELSWKRAESIKNFLIRQGVLAENIYTQGFGDTRPLNNNSTELLRQQNRRVEIRVIKQ